jgi:hypothetical protein
VHALVRSGGKPYAAISLGRSRRFYRGGTTSIIGSQMACDRLPSQHFLVALDGVVHRRVLYYHGRLGSFGRLAGADRLHVLLTYIWVQMGSLILVGAGTKNQMWLDALTSIMPLFLILYVVVQHHSSYVVLSSFQAKTAWATAYTMLLDVVIDLGVTVLLSRKVVDVGGGGVG